MNAIIDMIRQFKSVYENENNDQQTKDEYLRLMTEAKNFMDGLVMLRQDNVKQKTSSPKKVNKQNTSQNESIEVKSKQNKPVRRKSKNKTGSVKVTK